MSCCAAGYSLSCNKWRHKWKLEYKGLGKTKVEQDSQTCFACCGFKSSLAFETSAEHFVADAAARGRRYAGGHSPPFEQLGHQARSSARRNNIGRQLSFNVAASAATAVSGQLLQRPRSLSATTRAKREQPAQPCGLQRCWQRRDGTSCLLGRVQRPQQ